MSVHIEFVWMLIECLISKRFRMFYFQQRKKGDKRIILFNSKRPATIICGGYFEKRPKNLCRLRK